MKRPVGHIVAGLIGLGLTVVPSMAWAEVQVSLDQAKVLRLPPNVATVVIGNPLIADISVQRAGIAIITGKTYGVTNMIVLDAAGTTLSDEQVVVRAPEQSIVTVQRGMDRETLSCSPQCEKTVKVGDAQGNFDLITSQATNRAGLAQGQSPSK
jgi:Flp pilus assembly secretin CpaC